MRSRTLLVLAGVVAGSGATLFLTGRGLPSASAQPAGAPPQIGRYQVSAWGTGSPTHGAYVVDTATGEVYYVGGNGKPMPLGKAGRPLTGDS